MGHDISAHLKSNKEKEIAYNRRGAFNPLNEALYNALNAEKCNCGVSGCGESVEFSLDQIKKALDKVLTNDELEQEQRFFKDCIDADDGSGFVIDFY